VFSPTDLRAGRLGRRAANCGVSITRLRAFTKGVGSEGDKETRRQGDKETRRQGDKETRRRGEEERRRRGEEERSE
jgi:hypothetical protein